MLNTKTGTIVPHGTTKIMPPPLKSDTRTILGVDVSVFSKQAALSHISNSIASGQHIKIAFLNAHGANLAWVDDNFSRALSKFDVLADGLGVDMGSLINYGRKFPDNLNGTDFVPSLLGSLETSTKVALLGAAEGIAEIAASNLKRDFPIHEFTAVSHGYFSDDEGSAIVRTLEELKPDILLVAMGNPGQENWIVENCNKNNCTVVLGVGAFIDFAAGRVPRAPYVFRKLRIEWLYRLWLEPGRMWKRYLIGNPLFLLRSFMQKLDWSRHK